MDKELDFETFARRVAAYELNNTKCATSAHHSNGSGKDWEALQRELATPAERQSSEE